jgi:hypothetical protein
MLSFNECKKILNKKGENYSDKEVKDIISLLSVFVALDVESFKSKRNEESNIIR